jgi:hypothetical protein
MVFAATLLGYFRDDWDAEIVVKSVVRHIAWCICHCTKYFGLGPLDYSDTRLTGAAPLLSPIGPCGLYHSFVYQDFVFQVQMRFSS